MNSGYVLDEEEAVQQAMNTIQQYASKKRGDSFDLGSQGDMLVKFLEDPKKLANSLGLSEKQAANVRSLIVGGGTGAIHRYLSQHIGDEFAAMIGGFASAYIAKRILGR